ncbi:MAG: hypothetical protein ABIS08_03505 [Pseudolysinimonas sp.]
MIVNQRWGFSAVIAAIVGIGAGVLIAVLSGLGSGSRLVIGVGVGLLIGGALLTIFDRAIVRPALDTPSAAHAVPAFDPETGEALQRGSTSSFVGLSLEVWTLILVGLGILVVGVGVVLYLAG